MDVSQRWHGLVHIMSKEQRKKENDALIEKMRKGESLATVSVSATWWPPRPKIKKDLVKRLFDEN